MDTYSPSDARRLVERIHALQLDIWTKYLLD
jgi:hypothetical protein